MLMEVKLKEIIRYLYVSIFMIEMYRKTIKNHNYTIMAKHIEKCETSYFL